MACAGRLKTGEGSLREKEKRFWEEGQVGEDPRRAKAERKKQRT